MDAHLKRYIRDKIWMLENEFCIKLTNMEKYHFHELKTEDAVDRYAHRLLMDKL